MSGCSACLLDFTGGGSSAFGPHVVLEPLGCFFGCALVVGILGLGHHFTGGRVDEFAPHGFARPRVAVVGWNGVALNGESVHGQLVAPEVVLGSSE